MSRRDGMGQLDGNNDERFIVDEDDFCLCDRCGRIMAKLMVVASKKKLEIPMPAKPATKRKEYPRPTNVSKAPYIRDWWSNKWENERGQYVNKPWMGRKPPREASQPIRTVKRPPRELDRWVKVISPTNKHYVKDTPIYKNGYNPDIPSMTRT